MNPADCIHIRSASKLSHATAWMTRGRKESPTRSTHQATAQSFTEIVHAIRGKGVIKDEWKPYRTHIVVDGCEYCITRPVKATDLQIATVILELGKMEGWHYSTISLVLQAIDGMIAKIRRKPKVGMDSIFLREWQGTWKRGVICSETSNRAYIMAGLLPDWLKFGSPDDTWDYQMLSPDWRIVESSEGF